MLGMPKYDEAWHQQDLHDELSEYREAEGWLDRWSELSDVAYTHSRAHWSGHSNIAFPFSRFQFVVGVVYMIPKYTLRWGFFRVLGHRFDSRLQISEVRNPRKLEKLDAIAKKYRLQSDAFQVEAKRLLRYWPLLK